MSTNLDTYLPFASGAGSNVTEEQWRDLAEQWFPTGVVFGYANQFAVAQRAAGANMSVDVATGQARIRGHEGINTSIKNLGIGANATGNPRIDTVVLRADFVNDVIVLDVLAGTAAVNPSPPALTQNSSMWEIALANVWVAAAAATIATADLRDRRVFIMQEAQRASKEPVRCVTTTALAASTVTGLNRVANANGALAAIDGVTLVAGDRLLDKDHATGAQRGIWRVVDPGSASQPWRMERPDDFDSDADVRAGTWVRVTEGTANADTGWLLTTNDPITFGTTSLTFTQFPAAASTLTAVACKANLAVAQSINNTTETAILFDAESYDTDSIHSLVTNTSRFTIPAGKGGKWLVAARALFNANTTGIRRISVYVGGVLVDMFQVRAGDGANGDSVGITTTLSLSAGDYIEVFVYQSSGGALNVLGTGAGVGIVTTCSVVYQGA